MEDKLFCEELTDCVDAFINVIDDDLAVCNFSFPLREKRVSCLLVPASV